MLEDEVKISKEILKEVISQCKKLLSEYEINNVHLGVDDCDWHVCSLCMSEGKPLKPREDLKHDEGCAITVAKRTLIKFRTALM